MVGPWKGDGMKPRKVKATLALAFVACAVIYLIATAASQSTMYYLTVEEAFARGARIDGQWLRVSGSVPGETIRYNPETFRLDFHVEHNGHRLPAVYYGVMPDTLMDGANVVLEGSMRFEEGYFEVDRLLVQCASKYEAVDSYDGYGGATIEEIGGAAYEAYESGRVGR